MLMVSLHDSVSKDAFSYALRKSIVNYPFDGSENTIIQIKIAKYFHVQESGSLVILW